MTRSTLPPYLRLVEPPLREDVPATIPSERFGALLGFVDMSRVSDIGLEMILSRIQPTWVFDLRPVPYFDIGRLDRKRVFELFRTWCTTYRDVAGSLRITEHNDASLNSGVVGSYLRTTIAMRPVGAPIVVLVDDEDTMHHAMRVLPHSLGTELDVLWYPRALDVEVRCEDPDLVLRTESGQRCTFDVKWLGDREPNTTTVVEHVRVWSGLDSFSVMFDLDTGSAIEVSLPIAAVVSFEHHLDSAIARCLATRVATRSLPREATRRSGCRIASRVDRVSVRDSADGSTILLTFVHPNGARTHAHLTIDAAQQLRSQLQHLERR